MSAIISVFRREDVAAVIEMFTKGMTPKEISSVTGFSEISIRMILKRWRPSTTRVR